MCEPGAVFGVPKHGENGEEQLRFQAMTGLDDQQLTELVARVHAVHGGGLSPVPVPTRWACSARLRSWWRC